MNARGNAQTRAVHLAKADVESVIRSFGEQGHFMDRTVSPRAQAVRDRIAANPDASALLDMGYPQYMADQVARGGSQ